MLRYTTHMQREKSRLKNMLGNNIRKFFRPLLEDKVLKCKWKFWWDRRSIKFGCKGTYEIYKRHPNGKT